RQLHFRDLLAGHGRLDEAVGRYAPLSPSRRMLPSRGSFPMCYGPSYIAGELAEYIEAQKMSHVRGAPLHPQTQGKIERWHQTLKNRILLENYFLPGDLEARIEAFVEHYNHQRYHESLSNVTPADAYFGRAPAIIKLRERIKRQTIEHRRLQHRKFAA
ncbi:integrase core domain-containing protein, partial [Sphingobium cupriresistens]|uniref:integrase core domain-containing protein n=1 Tax=Sphingobium cupriresistens TaxID=1132417 RepID=UPI001F5C8B65